MCPMFLNACECYRVCSCVCQHAAVLPSLPECCRIRANVVHCTGVYLSVVECAEGIGVCLSVAQHARVYLRFSAFV